MLKGISPVVSPDLLKTLAEMGHGDEIVISDAHFPGHTFNARVIRADGLDAFEQLMATYGIIELARTGKVALSRSSVPTELGEADDSE